MSAQADIRDLPPVLLLRSPAPSLLMASFEGSRCTSAMTRRAAQNEGGETHPVGLVADHRADVSARRTDVFVSAPTGVSRAETACTGPGGTATGSLVLFDAELRPRPCACCTLATATPSARPPRRRAARWRVPSESPGLFEGCNVVAGGRAAPAPAKDAGGPPPPRAT